MKLQSCLASDIQLHLRLTMGRAAKPSPEEIVIRVEAAGRLKDRVVDELSTTFRSYSSWTMSHCEALDIPIIAVYNRRATGENYRAENDSR
jgi:hypothetical protein